MSSHFRASQYEDAFTSKALSNWQVPANPTSTRPRTPKSRVIDNPVDEDSAYSDMRPRTLTGCTSIISNDRGHLVESKSRSDNNPWGNFVGTWDMPKKIAGNQACVPTARSSYAHQKLTVESHSASGVLSGETKNESRKNRVEPDPAKAAPPPAAAAPAAAVPPAPEVPVEVMCDVIPEGRSPTPPAQSPKAPNPALIDASDKPLFRSEDL